MQRLSDLLGQGAKELGVTDRLARYQLRLHWAEVVGQYLARQSEPTNIKNGTLFIRTTNSLWSTEIGLHSREIIERLNTHNQHWNGPRVEKLRCKVGPLAHVHAPQQESHQQIDWSSIQLSASAVERVERVARELSDPKLRAAALRALTQMEKRRIWSFRQGLQPCLICSNMQQDRICFSCNQEKARQRKVRLLKVLGRRPWLRFKDLQLKVPQLKLDEFLRCHTQLRSILERNYWMGRDALLPGQRLGESLRQIMLDLTMLTTGANFQELSDRHLFRTFGKLWAEAFKADSAPTVEEIEADRKRRREKRAQKRPDSVAPKLPQSSNI